MYIFHYTHLSVMYSFSVMKSNGAGLLESLGSHGARGSIYTEDTLFDKY